MEGQRPISSSSARRFKFPQKRTAVAHWKRNTLVCVDFKPQSLLCKKRRSVTETTLCGSASPEIATFLPRARLKKTVLPLKDSRAFVMISPGSVPTLSCLSLDGEKPLCFLIRYQFQFRQNAMQVYATQLFCLMLRDHGSHLGYSWGLK